MACPADVRTDIEKFRLGRQINGEAIQTMSLSVSHLVIQLEILVDINKTDMTNYSHFDGGKASAYDGWASWLLRRQER